MVTKSGGAQSDAWEPVATETRVGLVAKRFVELLKQGVLKPGDRVPSEADLAKLLGVGRSTVREAKGLLIAKQLISGEPGRGTFVRALDGLPIDQDMMHLFLRDETWAELLQARLLLETELTFLACKNATDQDIKLLEASLEAAAAEDDLNKVYDLTVEFHQLVADASKNMVLAKLYKVVAVLLHSYQKPNLRSSKKTEIEAHRILLDAICARDAVAARERAREHVLSAADRTDLPRDVPGRASNSGAQAAAPATAPAQTITINE